MSGIAKAARARHPRRARAALPPTTAAPTPRARANPKTSDGQPGEHPSGWRADLLDIHPLVPGAIDRLPARPQAALCQAFDIQFRYRKDLPGAPGAPGRLPRESARWRVPRCRA